MSKCTAAQAIEAAKYWVGYCEKASRTYSVYRDTKYFTTDAGSNNYNYPAYYCGNNPAEWCGYLISTAIAEACGDDKTAAKEIMHGVWPYANVTQVYDAAPSAYKGRRGSFTPAAGDIVVFSSYHSDYRTHTGLVYAVDNSYIYTIEGNSSNKCQKRSYLKTDTYIYGYVRPLYAEGGTVTEVGELYGDAVSVEVHTLSKGVSGPEVKTLQRICYARGIKDDNGNALEVDGIFGANTKAAVIKLQAQLGVTQDGIVGVNTWTAMLTKLD